MYQIRKTVLSVLLLAALSTGCSGPRVVTLTEPRVVKPEVPVELRTCQSRPVDRPTPDLRSVLQLLNETWAWAEDCESKFYQTHTYLNGDDNVGQ